jgi:hypothetical protein
MNPQSCIVPVLAIDEAGNIQHFLGTGSFVQKDHLLLTADHVIRDWSGRIAVVLLSDLSTLFPASVVHRDQQHDIALLFVPGYKAPQPLSIVTEHNPNQFVVCFEYGTTRVAGKNIRFSPATRIGNITRSIDVQDMLGPAGDDALELSFPALKGASGAPVLSNDVAFALHGMVVSNVSYHLLPVQIESVIDNGAKTEEHISYMLPQALAVNSKHVLTAIAAASALPGSPIAG